MTTAKEQIPPRRQDFENFTAYDAAWKQWMVDQITHLHWCIDEAKETARNLLSWMRREELHEAKKEGAQEVTRKQRALIAGAWNSLGGKNLLFGAAILLSGAAGLGLGRLL